VIWLKKQEQWLADTLYAKQMVKYSLENQAQGGVNSHNQQIFRSPSQAEWDYFSPSPK
jgi:hypothetical protein